VCHYYDAHAAVAAANNNNNNNTSVLDKANLKK
jgi:hypothetical protein